ncbi:MAG: C1 family peptidase [Gammaproteobacteria bacterium]
MSKSKVNGWYGWIPDRPDYRDKLYAAIATPPKKLPSKVDLRAGCSSVENQGNTSSCTANALVGNLEFLEKKASRPAVNLSRLFIYYNERAMEGDVNSDQGAAIRNGVKSLVKQGVCPESEWPFKIAMIKRKPSAVCYKQAADHRITSYHRIIGLKQMRECLAEGYPFVFGFTVYSAFESAAIIKTGKLNLPKPGEKSCGGHAICAVGYNDATKRLLIRNSWGADWGMKGYFTMPYDYASNNNLADDFWTIRAFENE